jgi:drug/metabolite transporter (DMT)-like permease
VNSGATLNFGALIPSSGSWRNLPPKAWTCVGLIAIPLWATWPPLALRALTIPAFECLTIAFAFGWLALARLEKAADRAEATCSPSERHWAIAWAPAIACALGLTGSNAFHIFATHYIPAAEANLISYLWPVEIVAIGAALKLFKLRLRHVAGLCLGFAGAIVLMGGSEVLLSPTGIGLALFSGISWAAYCVFRLIWKDRASRVLQRGCAISTLLCAVLHFAFEPTVAPDLGALAASAAVGIVPLAAGNLVWDEGFRRGDSQLLAVMAYATPLCSALLLAALGLEAFTRGVFIGAALIVIAGFLSHTKP